MKTRRSEVRNQKSDVRRPTSVLCFRTADLQSLVPGFRSFLRVGAALLMTTLLFGVALAVEGDVVFERKGEQGGNPAAVFPHWVHRIRYKCYACHPSPFRMSAGANQVSMELIQEGKSCGVCHNGKRAWGVTFDTCNRCHVGQ